VVDAAGDSVVAADGMVVVGDLTSAEVVAGCPAVVVEAVSDSEVVVVSRSAG